PYYSRRRQVEVHLDRQDLPVEVIYHVKRPEPAAAPERIAHEVHRPAPVYAFRHCQRRRSAWRQALLASTSSVQVERTVNAVYPLMVPCMPASPDDLEVFAKAP